MWIHFRKLEYGLSLGGGLKEPFYHLGRIISDRFEAEKIEFPYNEIEIELAFPSSKEKDEKAIAFYNKLPIYYRGKNMVRVTLPVAEEEKSLTDVFSFIHKAFDMIASKKKKDDPFDADKMRSTLFQLEKELQEVDMHELSRKYDLLLRRESIDRQIQDRAIRQQSNREKKRLIYDLRLYYHFDNIGRLYFDPYDARFCHEILEKLRERKFRLPGYTHIYITVSNTVENALHSVYGGAVDWFASGIAVLENYREYATMQEEEKKRVVFDLLKQGLNDIAQIDKLDIKTLNEVLAEVEQEIFG